MRIANQVPNYMPTPGNSRKNANSFTGQSFRSQVDLASTRHLDQCNFTAAPAGRWMDVSAYCKLMDSYRSWKDRQPPQELPGGQGPTKENIDYLKGQPLLGGACGRAGNHGTDGGHYLRSAR